ncbi:putative transcriptional regulator [Nostocoides japonicum T1-X7]|uniref:Putative transcriptional regulator n=1 Tax=Nostocoides japonicum T1-X7 TaxID=1194083 RepID=A0A077M2F2_9MICO|nr:sugar-binding domain-containing protein [Tetrasphaera japonica]CCH80006.1 putative transcriptional regulator [Tetrasphaera japonica T1-X7]
MAAIRGPSEAVLVDAVARRHYLLGQSKVDIAHALGISRFKVARLLELAMSSGVVRIEIVGPSGIEPILSEELRQRMGLEYAVVVAAEGSGRQVREELGAAGAGLVAEIVGPDDVLGLPWSRSVNDVVDRITDLPPVPVVQLSGALVLPDENSSSPDVVRRAARITGGPGHVFYAPLVLDDAASAAALRRDPAVRDAMRHVSTVTVAVIGVGAWRCGASTIHDLASEQVRRAVADAGAVGEVAGVVFDRMGREIDGPLAQRVVSVTAEQLRRIPHVVAVAHGPAKAGAIAAAVRGHLVTSLVTTADTARVLLEEFADGVDGEVAVPERDARTVDH